MNRILLEKIDMRSHLAVALAISAILACASPPPAKATPWESYCRKGDRALDASSKTCGPEKIALLKNSEEWYRRAQEEASGWGIRSEIYGRSLKRLGDVHAAQRKHNLALAEYQKSISILKQFKQGYVPDLAFAYEAVAALEEKRNRSAAGQMRRIAATIWATWVKQGGETKDQILHNRMVENDSPSDDIQAGAP